MVVLFSLIPLLITILNRKSFELIGKKNVNKISSIACGLSFPSSGIDRSSNIAKRERGTAVRAERSRTKRLSRGIKTSRLSIEVI